MGALELAAEGARPFSLGVGVNRYFLEVAGRVVEGHGERVEEVEGARVPPGEVPLRVENKTKGTVSMSFIRLHFVHYLVASFDNLLVFGRLRAKGRGSE